MDDISLHILDIAENSFNADAKKIEIIINEDIENDKLEIEINDDGKGMDEETVKKLKDPFFTSRKTRNVGLGIPFLLEAAKAANGDLIIKSEPGKGTKVKAFFQYSNIDRKPLGNMPETLVSLILLTDTTEIFYRHNKDSNFFEFNTIDLKKDLEIESLKNTGLLINLKKLIQNKLSEL